MPRVNCSYCGLPFKVVKVQPDQPVYCCTGCAMADRIPVDENGQFPVNAALVAAITTGFIFFNQILFWLLGVSIHGDGRTSTAANCLIGSIATGLALWFILQALQWKAGVKTFVDGLLALVSLGGIVVAFFCNWVWMAALSNLALIAWNSRGFFRKKTTK